MSRVYKCDVCGKVEPRSIRYLCACNPDVSAEPLNTAKYYAFNLFHDDLCDECLSKLERRISTCLYEMKKEAKEKQEEEVRKRIKEACGE